MGRGRSDGWWGEEGVKEGGERKEGRRVGRGRSEGKLGRGRSEGWWGKGEG